MTVHMSVLGERDQQICPRPGRAGGGGDPGRLSGDSAGNGGSLVHRRSEHVTLEAHAGPRDGVDDGDRLGMQRARTLVSRVAVMGDPINGGMPVWLPYR